MALMFAYPCLTAWATDCGASGPKAKQELARCPVLSKVAPLGHATLLDKPAVAPGVERSTEFDSKSGLGVDSRAGGLFGGLPKTPTRFRRYFFPLQFGA